MKSTLSACLLVVAVGLGSTATLAAQDRAAAAPSDAQTGAPMGKRMHKPILLATDPGAQVPADFDPLAHRAGDARSALRGKRLSDGLHPAGAAGGAHIAAQVKGGKVVGWVVTDGRGRAIPAFLCSTGDAAAGETICWKCAKGTDGNIHCWQIDCPVIVSNEPRSD